jgi:hypothetical protein
MKEKKKALMCFEVRINGQRICTASVGNRGVLTTVLTWIKRSAIFRPKDIPKEVWCKEELTLDVGGMIPSTNKAYSDKVQWINQTLAVGDEIHILIKKGTKHDTPPSRKREKGGPKKPKSLG